MHQERLVPFKQVPGLSEICQSCVNKADISPGIGIPCKAVKETDYGGLIYPVIRLNNEPLPTAGSGVSRTDSGTGQVLSSVHPPSKLRGILAQNKGIPVCDFYKPNFATLLRNLVVRTIAVLNR